MNFDFYGLVNVGNRGQICLPLDVRRDFGIKSGEFVNIVFLKKMTGILITKDTPPKIGVLFENNKVQDSGQIILPKTLRDEHNIKEGMKFLVMKKKGSCLLLLDFNCLKTKLNTLLKKFEVLENEQ
ncbi:Antidote-toxin recognition MazE, bacterial antitoxin [Candidatus Tiddalikarchaeum anstoanum]|nr:Antidote-toxin recognition MazE, bacterial antitoxin [Candidatus Tiddalikarchaeum anstoanum]